MARIQRGSWDAVEHFDPLLAPGAVVARRFGGDGGHGISYRAFPRPLTFYLAFDARRPPFSDRRLRQAVTLALDRRTLSTFWNQALPNVAQMGPGALQRAPTDMEPTARIIPPGLRGGGAVRLRPSDLDRARRLVGRRNVTARMAVQTGDERSRAFAGLVRAALAPLGIEVRPVVVADVSASLRDRRAGIQLAALATQLDYPDPASFLTQMLGHDVPAAWLPQSVHGQIARLARLRGPARDRAAVRLASRLATREVPVVAYGTPTIGALLGNRLGCRIWNGVDAGLDLAALCLERR